MFETERPRFFVPVPQLLVRKPGVSESQASAALQRLQFNCHDSFCASGARALR